MQPLKLYAGTCNLDSVSVCSVAMTVLARNQGLNQSGSVATAFQAASASGHHLFQFSDDTTLRMHARL